MEKDNQKMVHLAFILPRLQAHHGHEHHAVDRLRSAGWCVTHVQPRSLTNLGILKADLSAPYEVGCLNVQNMGNL